MDVAIVGIGIHPFGRHPDRTGLDMAAYAVADALNDAGLAWTDVEFAYGGSRDSGCADSLVSLLGLTGIPFTHIYNGCATAGASLAQGVQAIQAGNRRVGVVVGFDQHERGAFTGNPEDLGLPQWYGDSGLMLTTQFFAMKVSRYLHDHGISPSTLAKAAAKNYRNASLNPNAFRRSPLTEQEILSSDMLNYPLTKYMFCSPDDGAAAVVICPAEDAHRYTNTPVYIRSIALRTRRFGSFEVMAPWLPTEQADSPTADAATEAFEIAGIGPDEVQVAQVQDTEAGHEIIHMAETGLCKHGDQEAMLRNGDTEITGRLPINTDGGLIGNGEPIGASGLRQVYEIALQLRGQAGPRQVPNNPTVGFTQVYGAPGVSACAVLST